MVKLLITENQQPENQPSSLSSTAYYLNETVAKVLSFIDNKKDGSFKFDIHRGNYFLLAVATWLPNSENYLTSSGFVTYIFRINVI